jgi:hypothetical protein
VPIFLIVLTIPAQMVNAGTNNYKAVLIAVALVLTCGRAIYFQVVNERRGPEAFRQNMFDADYQSKYLANCTSRVGI